MPDPTHYLLPATSEACLFLDFDGTLVDIAPTPDEIDVPQQLISLLDGLDRTLEGRLALVSGRAIASIETHLPSFSGIVVGGHGAERRDKGGRVVRLAGCDEDIGRAHDWARQVQADHPDIRAELKRTGAAIHFRQATHLEAAARAAAMTYLETCEDMALQEAHMTIEVRPKAANKARAVEALMQREPFAGHRPIFAGDDQTDIPAMDFCRAADGIAISVNAIHPGADIQMASPRAVRALLQEWIR